MGQSGRHDALLEASIACFERFGIQRTTMDDIARAAGVSRKTVYRHFATKNDLVAAFAVRESRQACAAARRKLDLDLPPDLLVATAELVLLREAMATKSLRLFVEHDQVQMTLEVLDRTETRTEILAAYWTPVFDRLAALDALRTDATRAQMLRWIVFVHSALLTRPGSLPAPDEEESLLEWLRSFLSPAVVAMSAGSAPQP